MANKVVLKSNLKKVIREVGDGVEELVDEWKDVGLGTAQEKLLQQEEQRGYNLQEMYDSLSAERRELSAAILVGVWYAHFLEYGTIYIQPMPFLRPGKRAADKVFRANAERKIQSRVNRARVI